MTERGEQLHATAARQIAELIDLMAKADEATLRLRCPGRAKLGDGSVAACAQHTTDNYKRIAAFVQTSDRMSSGPGAPQHADGYTADNINVRALVEQLLASRETLGRTGEL